MSERVEPEEEKSDDEVSLVNAVGYAQKPGKKRSGGRDQCEDAYICNEPITYGDESYLVFGVFDGHRGRLCSDFVARNLTAVLKKNLQKIDPNETEAVSRVFSESFEEIDEDFRSKRVFTTVDWLPNGKQNASFMVQNAIQLNGTREPTKMGQHLAKESTDAESKKETSPTTTALGCTTLGATAAGAALRSEGADRGSGFPASSA